MTRRMLIKVGDVQVTAELRENGTAQAIWDVLPLKAKSRLWGDEISFEIPVDRQEENAQEVVDLGSIAYWPPGHHFCIFFGPTPKSSGDEIRATSPVNVVGSIEGDATRLRGVPVGSDVTLEQLSE